MLLGKNAWPLLGLRERALLQAAMEPSPSPSGGSLRVLYGHLCLLTCHAQAYKDETLYISHTCSLSHSRIVTNSCVENQIWTFLWISHYWTLSLKDTYLEPGMVVLMVTSATFWANVRELLNPRILKPVPIWNGEYPCRPWGTVLHMDIFTLITTEIK